MSFTLRILGILSATAFLFFATAMVIMTITGFQKNRRIAAEFELTPAGAEFALECINGDQIEPGSREDKRSLCGCIASEIARTLSEDEISNATFVFRGSRLNGWKVPAASEARSDEGRLTMSAIENAAIRCREQISNGV